MPGFEPIWRLSLPGGRTENVRVRGSLVTSNALALKQAALDGLGIALLARWMTGGDSESKALINLFPKHVATAANHPNPTMWLLRAPRAFTPRRVSLVSEAIVAAFGATKPPREGSLARMTNSILKRGAPP
jgi:DNA-binding transcriptional LysR family regulator